MYFNRIPYKTFGRCRDFFIAIQLVCLMVLKTIDAQQIHDVRTADLRKIKTKSDQSDLTYLDSMHATVSDIVITGNKVTDDDVILREINLKRGDTVTSARCIEDEQRVNALGLFASVDMNPILQPGNKVKINVKVNEKWYIYPIPEIRLYDGDIRKVSAGLNLRWQNFRGRNENLSVSFGLGYNDFVHASYTVPWIGENLHMFTSVSGGYSVDRNRSMLALGKPNGSRIYGYRDANFDYANYNAKVTIGKYFTKKFSVYTEGGYTYLRVTQDSIGRTISPEGVDKYMLAGFGLNYDTRNTREYSTGGYQVHFDYEHFGLLDDNPVNFGRLTLEQRVFLPVDISSDYSIVFASRLFTSMAIGPQIPIYNHEFLGYGNDFIRGWASYGFEGENEITSYNEVRLPVIQPASLRGEDIPVIKSLPYLKKFTYRYGLFFTVFYDIGTVWNGNEHFRSVQFLNGTGIGLNAILPFGMIGKVEYGFKLERPIIGQIIFGLGAKF